MENSQALMNQQEIPLEELENVEKILSIAAKYENYEDAVNNKIN